MDASLHDQIRAQLIAGYGFKEHGNWLQQGLCPTCGKKELYTHSETPWVIRCGRVNKCGWEAHVKDLYADLFEDWSGRFPASEASPTAAADAYLEHARGFDLARVRGWYTQEHYHDAKTGASTATVRFGLPKTYWERLIDRPHRFGKKKANFKFGGEYAGTWWKAPTRNLYGEEEIWLVEGIFDAIALEHRNIAAVSLLSCNNYPEQALADLAAVVNANGAPRPKLVWALDGDRAGRTFTRKWLRKARDAGWTCDAVQVPQPAKGKLDWNDEFQRGRLLEADIKRYRYRGALLIAESAFDKALIIYREHGLREFSFDYDNRLYWFSLNMARLDEARQAADQDAALTDEQRRDRALTEAGMVSSLANCFPSVLYYQANLLTDEAWYYFRIDFPHNGPAIKTTFTGSQIASSAEFKKRLLGVAPGAYYTGTSGQLDRILERQMRNIKSVQTIDFIGYSRDHQCFVYNDIAIKGGQTHRLNEEDFFEIGKLSVKTLNQSVLLSINADLSEYRSDWLENVWQCFGAKGIVALAFWLGALFSEQIRAAHKSFPFLEIVGEPGAGKSTLIEFMWKLLGRRDYEGFDPSKSSLAARARNFAQVSGMPVVLIEADRGDDVAKARQFDWDELKTAYNGRSVRAIGVKNGGNDTKEPPFRGAIVISQNAAVSASEAILQRLVHLHFDRAHQTPQSKRMAEALERTAVEDVSGFLLKATSQETAIMETVITRSPECEATLLNDSELRSVRIAKNHGQLMALVDALSHICPVSAEQRDAAYQLLANMAVERQQAINADHPIVQEFWDMFDYLDGGDSLARLNHSHDQNLIAVNLNHFATLAADRRQQVPALTDLKRHLRTSKVRKFIDVKSVRSVLRAADPTNKAIPSVIKCWVFQRTTPSSKGD
ncbi:hypothetical protein JOE11_001603 [Robbsia andropogonis]|uniref:toprim domain-containing protein n=1 Tax=Robbsia andropogonis TaxID=28092 RepID=UPI003D1F6DF6